MFAYGQFASGFTLSSPGALAIHFANLATRRGESFTLNIRRLTGRDAYGNPLYSEASAELLGFVEEEAASARGPSGERRTGKLRLYLPLWSPVEEGDTVDARGAEWTVGTVTRNRAYASAEASRRAE
jgi:hypothetical protein